MTNDELRALARQIVVDKLRDRFVPAQHAVSAQPDTCASHASHAIYVTVVNTGDSCVIEPDVPCTHCNYCKSHGY